MDVRLPNGQVVTNVPDDMTQSELHARLMRNGIDSGWKPPDDIGDKLKDSYVGRAVSNIPAGLESASRMVAGMPGYIAGGLTGAATLAGTGDINAAREVQDKTSETLNPASYIPQSDKSAQIDQMMSAGMEKAGQVGGDVAERLGQIGAVPAVPGIAYEMGSFGTQVVLNFAPIPGAKGLHAMVERAFKGSPYNALRAAHPDLAHMTDAEIVDHLEKMKEAAKDQTQEVPPQQDSAGPLQGDLDLTDRNDPMAADREAAQGELQTMQEQQEFLRREQTGTQDMFQNTGLEKADTGLEEPNKVVSSPVEPDGITNPTPEYGYEANRENIRSTDTPDTTQPELRLQDPSEYTNAVPYTNTIYDYIYQRFPELTEKLQADPVTQRLMTEVQKWTDHMKSTLDMGGSEFAKGMDVRTKNIELMPDVKVDAGRDLASSPRSQLEMNRLKAEYERSAQRLDVAVQQLSNRLKSRSGAVGDDIANNVKFSDWINDRLNSSGPVEGQTYTNGAYKEGAASANIQKTMGLKDHVANVMDALAEGAGGKLNFVPGDGLHTALTGFTKALIDAGHDTFGKAVTKAKEVLGKGWEKVKPYFQKAWQYVKTIQPGLSIKDVSRRPWELTRNEFHDEAAYQGVNRATKESNPSHWFTDQSGEARIFAEGGRGNIDNPVTGTTEPRIDIAYKSKLNTTWKPSDRPSGSNHAYTGQERNRPIEASIPLEAAKDPHRYLVEQALKNGEQVPARVLKDYPDLQAKGQLQIGKSQRGALGVKPEDPFTKFEKALPDAYKPYAKEMFKQLNEKTAKPDFTANKDQMAVDKVLNKTVGGINKYTRMTEPWGPKVKEQLLSHPDLGGSKLSRALANDLVPGANLRAFETGDPRIKYASDNIRQADQNVEIGMHDKFFGPDGIKPAWEKLNTKEQIALHKLMEKYRSKEDLTPERLAQEGMNQKQADAYKSFRDQHKAMLDELNAERVAHGQSPIPYEPGYMTSSWKGNFYFEVRERHADGRLELKRIQAGNWKGIGGKGGLASVRDKFILEHGDKYEVGPIEQRGRTGDTKATQQLFDQLVDMVNKGSQDKQALTDLFQRYNEELADATKNFREHFKVKTGVEGYQGDNFGISDKQAVKNMLYSAEGYLRDAHTYLETKRAARNVNGMLFDPEIRAQAPNALQYVRQYWDHSRGVEYQLGRVLDYLPEKLAESVGLSRYAITKTATQKLRAGMMLNFLGFNRPSFLLAQRMQSFQFSLPAMAKMQADLGLQGWKSTTVHASTKGYIDSGLALVNPEAMSDLGKQAMKYANDNRLIDTHYMGDIVSASTSKSYKFARLLDGERGLQWADNASRVDAYLGFTHLLSEAGLKGPELFAAAGDAMKRAMVDYSQKERPMIYKKMGMVGDLASPLTTFKHNYYTQLYMYGKDMLAHPTNPLYAKAAFTFLATQYILGGYMGLPGREDLDWVLDMARAHGLLDPRTPNVTQALAKWSSGLQDTQRNLVRYGVFGAATGMDISPTVGAAQLVPDQGIAGMFPIVTKAAEIAGNLANVGGKEVSRLWGRPGPTDTDKAALYKSIAPAAFKSVPEMINQDKQTGMIPNPKEHMAGDVRRGPVSMSDPNWRASILGSNTIKESEQRTAAFQSKLREEAIKTQKQNLLGQIKDLKLSGKDITQQAKQYVDLGGTYNEILNALEQNKMDQNRTRYERQQGIPKNLNQAQKYKRLEDYGITK